MFLKHDTKKTNKHKDRNTHAKQHVFPFGHSEASACYPAASAACPTLLRHAWTHLVPLAVPCRWPEDGETWRGSLTNCLEQNARSETHSAGGLPKLGPIPLQPKGAWGNRQFGQPPNPCLWHRPPPFGGAAAPATRVFRLVQVRLRNFFNCNRFP